MLGLLVHQTGKCIHFFQVCNECSTNKLIFKPKRPIHICCSWEAKSAPPLNGFNGMMVVPKARFSTTKIQLSLAIESGFYDE